MIIEINCIFKNKKISKSISISPVLSGFHSDHISSLSDVMNKVSESLLKNDEFLLELEKFLKEEKDG